ncbi:16S rRNA processing protein RimM [Lewinella marina]|uniref:Ribosome maturation factor RimM n=1 Tax=Neolewinella marina TaxID=438751 RepID=A0A2G0CFQ1_9BACT|nr:ribosome maturation factor RimM [Neolewinella marina]NJB85510.1 16S rRNA processing protein RimM [Neolewinella marina]PHK98801.1 16S rRNA processing protein RimM [Neolewinella marina]
MELVQIGTTGRPHGVRGELGLFVEEVYEDDLLLARAVLIGERPVPYFVERFRQGGKLTVKLEKFDTREQVNLLANRPLWLPAAEVSVMAPEEGTPWDEVIGYRIQAEGYPELGPIEDILDLPEHYLAEITHNEKTVYIPLHDDLVREVRNEDGLLLMELPAGLLDL